MAVVAGAVVLRAKVAPAAARLLPECDAIVYANLKPLRAATHFDRTPITRSPDFQQFIDATRIVPERDLNAVAFALHRMNDPRGPNGAVAYSEVFEGHFDGQRLATFLAGIATAKETYAGHDIFTIPVGETRGAGGRLLRVTQVADDTVAASNMPTPEQIHAMLDRHRAVAFPFAGPSLLLDRYGDVPVLSSAWAIGQIGLPFSEAGTISLFGLKLPLAEDSTFIASIRYVDSIRLRVEQVASSETEAARSSAALSAVLNLFRSLQQMQSGHQGQDAAVGQMMDSIKVEQARDRVVLTGNIPLEVLRRVTTPDAQTQAPPVSPPASH